MLEFWKNKSLNEMSTREWESLCDGCARCCLHKLEDEETGEVHYTSVVCQYLDEETNRCTCYVERNDRVPECVWLTPETAKNFQWLPTTCAYRLLAEGKALEWWHPLVSGSHKTVAQAGISIRGKCISEKHVHPDSFEERLIHWVEI